AKRESSFNPEAIGDGGDSYGLFQIRAPSWENELRSEGIISNKIDLLDSVTNTRAAAYIYKTSGFTPWSTWEEAVIDVETGGQLGPDPGTGTAVGDTLEDIQQGLNPLNLMDALGNLIGIITSADFWKRIGLGALGFFIIVAAIIFWNQDELQETVGAIK
ncbi:MAG: transglycosylase SLT domain-containing protein, partial [Nitrososphaera sp.]|nr:transglycosylase SLT domain-containing protein [Nitrososphaera sp.]